MWNVTGSLGTSMVLGVTVATTPNTTANPKVARYGCGGNGGKGGLGVPSGGAGIQVCMPAGISNGG